MTKKDYKQSWALKQDVRYLKEGIDEENQHFEECLEVNRISWKNVIKKVRPKCPTSCTNREHCLQSGTRKKQGKQKAKI